MVQGMETVLIGDVADKDGSRRQCHWVCFQPSAGVSCATRESGNTRFGLARLKDSHELDDFVSNVEATVGTTADSARIGVVGVWRRCDFKSAFAMETDGQSACKRGAKQAVAKVIGTEKALPMVKPLAVSLYFFP